jgi:hypothetical protein
MDSSEPINSITDDRILHINTRLEKDRDQVIKNVVQQSIYEEKMANNGLYASVFLHIFLILATVVIIVFDMELVSVYHSNNPDYGSMNFSVFHFNAKLNKDKSSYSYFCFEMGDYDKELQTTSCTIRDNCRQRGLNETLSFAFFELDCDHFIQIRTIGLIVIIF